MIFVIDTGDAARLAFSPYDKEYVTTLSATYKTYYPNSQFGIDFKDKGTLEDIKELRLYYKDAPMKDNWCLDRDLVWRIWKDYCTNKTIKKL